MVVPNHASGLSAPRPHEDPEDESESSADESVQGHYGSLQNSKDTKGRKALPEQQYLEELNRSIEAFTSRLTDDYRLAQTECLKHTDGARILEDEAHPIKFLRRENFSVWSAASRLCQYWKERVAIFGERAFLPMTATGHGALTPEDVRILRSDAILLVPPPSDDNERVNPENRVLVFFDPSRLQGLSQHVSNLEESYRRCCFYLGQRLATYESCQVEGFHFIALLPSMRSLEETEIYRALGREPLSLLAHAMPIRLRKIYLVNASTMEQTDYTEKKLTFHQVTVPNAMEFLGTAMRKRSIPVFASSKVDLCQQLERVGLSRTRMPKIVGGQWEVEENALLDVSNSKDHSSLLHPLSAVQRKPAPLVLRMAPTDGPESQPSASTEANGLIMMQEAIGYMPHEEKAEYLEALKRSDSLIQDESPPVRFLRFEKFDPWAAARRLVTYWKTRKQFFGDRFYLPLSLDVSPDESALSEADRAIIGGGCHSVVYDNQNHALAIVNEDRIPVALKDDLGARGRSAFYALTCVAQRSFTVSMLHFISPHVSYERHNFHALSDAIEHGLTLRIRSIHVLVPPSVPRTVALIMQMYKEARYKGESMKLTMNFTNSKRELVSRLEAAGVPKNVIPRMFGGTFTYDQNAITADWRKRLASSGSSASDHEDGPHQETVDHLSEAIERAPRVVERDSPLNLFVQTEDGNEHRALRRRREYWDRRKSLFGDRCFLPVTMTNDGVLTQQEQSSIDSGFVSLLDDDNQGRPVIFFDPSRILSTSGSDADTVLRVVFYFGSILAENTNSRSDGCVVLIAVNGINCLPRIFSECITLLRQALPICIHSFHFLVSPLTWALRSFTHTASPLVVRFLED